MFYTTGWLGFWALLVVCGGPLLTSPGGVGFWLVGVWAPGEGPERISPSPPCATASARSSPRGRGDLGDWVGETDAARQGGAPGGG